MKSGFCLMLAVSVVFLRVALTPSSAPRKDGLTSLPSLKAAGGLALQADAARSPEQRDEELAALRRGHKARHKSPEPGLLLSRHSDPQRNRPGIY